MTREERRLPTGPLGRPATGPLIRPAPKVYIVCNQHETAPAWGYILRQKGLSVVTENSLTRAVEQWAEDVPDVVVIDIDSPHPERLELCKQLRDVSAGPLLLLLPTHHETEMLEAYAAGVDDCIIKPVSPAIFAAKVLAWAQRSWTVPVEGIRPIQTSKWKLDPHRRSLVHSDGGNVPLTNLEFRLLNLLMSKPGQVFGNEELIRVVWGNYGQGDEVLLKNAVYRLRKKLEGAGCGGKPVQTWQGGYTFIDN